MISRGAGHAQLKDWWPAPIVLHVLQGAIPRPEYGLPWLRQPRGLEFDAFLPEVASLSEDRHMLSCCFSTRQQVEDTIPQCEVPTALQEQAIERLRQRKAANDRESKRRQARTVPLQVGDQVLVRNRHPGGKFRLPFEMTLWTVVRIRVNPKGSLCSDCASGFQCNGGSCLCSTEGSGGSGGGGGPGDSCINDINCGTTPATCCANSYLFDTATKCCKAFKGFKAGEGANRIKNCFEENAPTTTASVPRPNSAGGIAGAPLVTLIISTGLIYLTHIDTWHLVQ
ncbi:hypothetical protein NDU88_001516 [Pleurodeles waltl]|uniref:Uncharacterized protein n=1 Tax=Pleurodeles waltl TaxID=8319 RepID=A0AAV7TII5_PLEWA|nr:hypothetical protein NDU88_001516 [Pleurodeles waltl]